MVLVMGPVGGVICGIGHETGMRCHLWYWL